MRKAIIYSLEVETIFNTSFWCKNMTKVQTKMILTPKVDSKVQLVEKSTIDNDHVEVIDFVNVTFSISIHVNKVII